MWHAARAEKAEMKKEQEQLAQWKAEAEKFREQKIGEEDQVHFAFLSPSLGRKDARD